MENKVVHLNVQKWITLLFSRRLVNHAAVFRDTQTVCRCGRVCNL